MSVGRYDAVVVGAGVMGASTAAWLARRGRRVTLLERFAIGHGRGSSHGRARIFRLSYPDATYVEMAQEALGLWRELERETSQPLLTTTGGFDVGDAIDKNASALHACGASFEMLDEREASRRFPQVAIDANERALYQPDSGIVGAEEAWRTFARRAVAHGAALHERTPAVALEPTGSRVVVVCADRTIEADVAIVTAGPWARDLLSTAGIDLDTRPTRETVAYFETYDATPTFVEWGRPAIYALPSPGQGIKAGEHVAGATTDPDQEGEVDRQSIARLTEWVAHRFPGAARGPHFAETCLYTNTTDEHFVLERHGRIVVGSPCSGHGFKFAPLIGKRLAELAAEAFG